MLLAALALSASMAQSTPPADTTPVAPQRAIAPEAVLATAYVNEDARRMVRHARARRAWADSSIAEYRVLGRERVSVGIRALRRDRMLFRREIAADILWRRDRTGAVRLLGARQVVPVATPRPHVPEDRVEEAEDLAFDPTRELLLAGFAGSGPDETGDDHIRDPLAEGSEIHYRFAAGDTTRIRLPSGRELRLAELRVIPRRLEGLLLRGSLWLELDTHSIVRAVFQLARPLDVVRDLGEEESEIPGILQPLEIELRYLTIDYGLWEDRWWMPRLISLEGEARAGNLARVPVRFERSYEEYQIRGVGQPPIRIAAADTAGLRVAEEDSARARAYESCRYGEGCWRYERFAVADSLLLAAEHLPGSIYDEGSRLITEDELRQLADVLRVGARSAPQWHPPLVRTSYLRPELMRYNRVEGLALGARVDADFGALRADGTVWLGAADRQPNAEIRVSREGFTSIERAAAYRRLVAVDPDSRALGLGSSLSALVLARDDSDYYRTVGVEVTGEAAAPRRFDYSWRSYVELQTAAEKGTDVSIPRLFGATRGFHDNIEAQRAFQQGVELRASYSRVANPLGFRAGVAGTVRGERGDHPFVRPGATVFLGFPLPLGVVAGLEVAGGTAFGDVPAQGRWYIGGPSTVRGYGGASRVSGEAFWRARAEVGTSRPGARVALFSDAGWAGARDAFETDPALLSAGIGASLLDGLLRMDLARALRADRGWRFDLYLDGVL